ncbi:unnamed protein product [Agarophyton chilense]
MNNAQQAFSNDGSEAIRRLQREWRIAKRKEIEDKKRKKKFRAMETPAQVSCNAAPQYLTMQSNSVSLPHNSAASVHFPFQPHIEQRQTNTASPLFVNSMQVDSVPSHSQQHASVELTDEKQNQFAQHHSGSSVAPPRSQETGQYSSSHIAHSNRDSVDCSPPSMSHGVMHDSTGSIEVSAGMSQPVGSHYLSSTREGSTFTALGEQKVPHLQNTAGAQRSTAVDNNNEHSGSIDHAVSEETRRKMEVEEAQRRWRENKRREIAMKRARAASSKRGRKRTKFLHQHPIIGHPVHVVSGSLSLHPSVSFQASTGPTNALPVPSALHNFGTNDQVQVSSGEVSSAMIRSIGTSASEPISSSIGMSGPSHAPVSFPLSSVPIPSSVAVPVVPALTIQHIQSSNFGAGHDPDPGFNSSPLNASNQYSNMVTPERVPHSGMNTEGLHSIPEEDGAVALYEPLPQNTREPAHASGAQAVIPAATEVCATDLIDSRSNQNDVPDHTTGRGQSKPLAIPPDTDVSSPVKMADGSRLDQPASEEVENSRTEKEEIHFVAAQTAVREHENSEATAATEPQIENGKRSTSNERTTKQFEDNRKPSVENGAGKEFEDPQESFQEDGSDDIMNSVNWHSLGSIDNR